MDWFHSIYNVQAIITAGGVAALVAVVFAETGLLVGFFLPGDSLLVTAGVFCTSANPTGHPLLNIVSLNLAVGIAAVLGDQVGFYIGRKAGPESSPAKARSSSTSATSCARTSSMSGMAARPS